MEEEEEEKLKKEQEKILSKLCEMISESSQETALCEEDLEKISENDTYFTIRDVKNEEKKLLDFKIASSGKNMKKERREKRKRNHKKNKSENVQKPKQIKLTYEENAEKDLCLRIVEQSNDSGIGTSSEQFARTVTPEVINANSNDIEAMVTLGQDPPSKIACDSYSSQDSIVSKESVSLLQNTDAMDCNVEENNGGMERGISVAWNIKIFPTLSDDQEDEEIADQCVSIINKANKCVQTDWEFHKADASETVQKNIHFLRCVIEMKNIFSTKVDVPTKKILNILKNVSFGITTQEETTSPSSPSLSLSSSSSPSEEEYDSISEDSKNVVHAMKNLDFKKKKILSAYKSKETWRRRHEKERKVSRETMHYIMRTTDAEDVMEKSVDSLLLWLKNEMQRDLINLCRYWKNSIKEDIVEMLNLAVDSENGSIRKKVSDFLQEIVDEIHSPESPVEDSLLEYKTSFLANLCQSVYLEYDLIMYLEKKLENLKDLKWIRGEDERKKKLRWIHLMKASYLFLRLLEELMQKFFVRLNEIGICDLIEKKEEKEWSVVEMWRRYWQKTTEPENEEAGNDGCRKRYLSVASEWLNCTDGMVKLSVKEAPLLAVMAEKCSSNARKILLLIENAEGDAHLQSVI